MKRFWSKVDVRGPDDCWEWQAAKTKAGYGWFWAPQKRTSMNAHRVAFFIHRRYWAKGYVLHSCDNRLCVNPAHLRDGTQADNMRDMFDRGRKNHKGKANPSAKLTPEIVDELRRNPLKGQAVLDLAKDLGVSFTTIYNVQKGRTWLVAP
jgi:hypothetical protein